MLYVGIFRDMAFGLEKLARRYAPRNADSLSLPAPRRLTTRLFPMKKLLALLLLAGIFAAAAHAQTAPAVDKKKHKIVFQLTSSDTLVQKSLVKQLANALDAAPNSKIEVVCHNNGIVFLQKDKTAQAAKIKELAGRGIVFVACRNTLRERKIADAELVPEAGFVPAGIIEIADKQEKGWAYLKAGF